MLVEIFFCLFLVCFFFVLGLPLSYLLFSKYRSWTLLATLTGVALAVVLNTSLWVNGTTIKQNFWAIILIEVFFFLIFIRIYRKRRQVDLLIRKDQIKIYFVGLALILFPLLINGPQFSFFQGNIWDTFGYWESSQIYALEKFDRIRNFTEEELTQIPARRSAKKDLYARPGVHALYALTTHAVPSWRWRLHPIFLGFLLSQIILVFLFWLDNERDRTVHNKWVLLTCVLSYPIGFWGQYIFDINSWGNLSSVALIILICWIVREVARYGYWKMVLALAVFLGSIFFLYPEIAIFYAPGLLFLSLYELWKAEKFAFKKFSMGIVSIILSLILASSHYQGTIEFVVNQIRFGSSETHGMWTYFQKFFFGQGDLAAKLKEQAELLLTGVDIQYKTYAVGKIDWIYFVKNFISSHGGIVMLLDFTNNLVLGLLGFYWLTIPTSVQSPGYDLLVVAIFSTLVISTVILISRINKRSIWGLLSLLAGLVLTVAIFIFKKQFWSVGKGISFLMPAVYIVLAVSILDEKSQKTKALVTLFFGLQLVWGMYRLTSVNENGIHYPYPPYPSIQKHVIELKSIFNSDFYEFVDKVHECNQVSIQEINPWSSRVIEGVLLSHNIPFTTMSQKLEDMTASEEILVVKNNGQCTITKKY